MSKSRERREFPRVPFQMAATIRGDHVTVVSGDIRDVSLKGMFAAGAGRLPAGCRCQVELVMGAPGQEMRLSLRGRVTRVDNAGMGIEFLEMGLDALAQLNHSRPVLRQPSPGPAERIDADTSLATARIKAGGNNEGQPDAARCGTVS